MYPVPYFLARQFGPSGDFDDQQLGVSRYQYGTATRGMNFMQLPAAAAFSAVAPFDFFDLVDSFGRRVRFEFRPDIAPPVTVAPVQTPSAANPGAKVIPIQGLATGALVAEQTVEAIRQVSLLAANAPDLLALAPGAVPTGRLGIWANQNIAQAVDDEVLLQMLAPGGRRGWIDPTGITAVAGFNPVGGIALFDAGAGGLIAGKTHATGFIIAVAGASLVDTETFTIQGRAAGPNDDPAGVIFEFDSGGGVTAGRVAVPFTGVDTSAVVAASIVAAINNPGNPPAGPNSPGLTDWRATASISPLAPQIVLLRYDFPGSLAGSVVNPKFITNTVANPAFIVAGMGGGQFGSLMAPIRWGLSRGAIPVIPGPDQEVPE